MKKEHLVLVSSLLSLIMLPAVLALNLGPLHSIAEKFFNGQFMNDIIAAKTMLALFVFLLLYWATSSLFKNRQGTGVIICIIVSIMCMVGLPNQYVAVIYAEYAAVVAILLLFVPIVFLIYINKRMKQWMGDSKWGYLVSAVIAVVLLILLQFISKALKGKSIGLGGLF